MSYEYVVTEPCIGEVDHACVDVCPVDCFYEAPDQLVIDPDECIGCGACVAECPVNAIFAMDDVPAKWHPYIEKNARITREDNPAVAMSRAEWQRHLKASGGVVTR